MAQFIKAPNLWEAKTINAINDGSLVLQVGQWVRCGDDGVLSRYVSHRNGVFDCVHRNGVKGDAKSFYNMNKRFKLRAVLHKIANGKGSCIERGEAMRAIINHPDYKAA